MIAVDPAVNTALSLGAEGSLAVISPQTQKTSWYRPC